MPIQMTPAQQQDYLMSRSVMDTPRGPYQVLADVLFGRTFPEQSTSAFTNISPMATWFRAGSRAYPSGTAVLGKRGLGKFFSKNPEVAKTYGAGLESYEVPDTLKTLHLSKAGPQEWTPVYESLLESPLPETSKVRSGMTYTYGGGADLLDEAIDKYGPERVRAAMQRVGYEGILNPWGQGRGGFFGPSGDELILFDPSKAVLK